MEVVTHFKMKYQIKDVTPKEARCIVGGCSAIYELTPEEARCIIDLCPGIYDSKDKGKYWIIGKLVPQTSINEAGLEIKVGEGEALIEVPKELIDKIKR